MTQCLAVASRKSLFSPNIDRIFPVTGRGEVGERFIPATRRRGVAVQGLNIWRRELGCWVPVPASSLNQLTRPLKASASLDVDWGRIAWSWVLSERMSIFTASCFERLLCVRNCVGATVINCRSHPPGLLVWAERNGHQRDGCTNNHVGVIVIMTRKKKQWWWWRQRWRRTKPVRFCVKAWLIYLWKLWEAFWKGWSGISDLKDECFSCG